MTDPQVATVTFESFGLNIYQKASYGINGNNYEATNTISYNLKLGDPMLELSSSGRYAYGPYAAIIDEQTIPAYPDGSNVPQTGWSIRYQRTNAVLFNNRTIKYTGYDVGTEYTLRKGRFGYVSGITIGGRITISASNIDLHVGDVINLPYIDDETFIGWYNAESGGTKIGDAGDAYTINTPNVTLYARFSKEFDVIYVYYTGGTENIVRTYSLNGKHTVQTINNISEWQQYQSSETIESGSVITVPKTGTILYAIQKPDNTDKMRAVLCMPGCELDLGEIQTITDTYSANLTVYPVLPFGYGRNFAIDTGVQRSITLSYKRFSPIPCNDDGENNNSLTWSNKKWIEEYKKFTDRWQMETNGCRLYLLQPKDQNGNALMPDMYSYIENEAGLNCYISGAPMPYKSGYHDCIEDSISLRVGTIYPKPEDVPMTTVYLKTANDDETALVPASIQFPSGSWSPLPYVHISDDKFLMAWCKKIGDNNFVPVNSGIEPALSSYPKDPFNVDTNTTIYAQIFDPSQGRLITAGGQYTDVVVAGHTYTIICVGGGGGGGSCDSEGTARRSITAGGGGGGSGYVNQMVITAQSNTITVTIGAGGAGASYDTLSDGGDGGETKVEISGEPTQTISASGGKGGKHATATNTLATGGEGGDGYMKGGKGGNANYNTQYKGDNGERGSSYTHSAGGYGFSSGNYHYGGGGGGAQPYIVYGLSTNDAYGGDGTGESKNTYMNGTYGGGGGGASYFSSSELWPTSGGNGGNGYVYIFEVPE